MWALIDGYTKDRYNFFDLNKKLSTRITNTIFNEVLPSNPGGFIFDAETLELATFDDSTYFVSLNGFEKQFTQRPCFEEIRIWIEERLIYLTEFRYIGYWYDLTSGKHYLDISIAVVGHEAAKLECKRQNQISVYHPQSDLPYSYNSDTDTLEPPRVENVG